MIISAKSRVSRGPAAEADRLIRNAFTSVAVQPVPEHLIDLVDELEDASRTGRLSKPSQAA